MEQPPARVLRIGLTGGIASGKSAVADFFAELGVCIIDTDIIAREVVASGQPGLEAVTAAFGKDILQTDGSLDRAKLRKTVFADAAAREQLESILHPLIRAQTLAQSARQAQSGPYQMIAVPLLIESGFIEMVDRVLVVDCPVNVQIQRVMARDHVSEADAKAAVHAQTGRAERLAQADDIIVNAGTLDELAKQVRDLHATYLRLAAA